MGLLNPGGPIAQFKRNRCSISPVEVILLSGVRINGSAGFERLAIGSFPGGQAAGCAAVTAEHGVAAVIAVPAELPKRPRKKAGAVRHAVSDPLLTIFFVCSRLAAFCCACVQISPDAP